MKTNIIILTFLLGLCLGYAYYLNYNNKPVFSDTHSNINQEQTIKQNLNDLERAPDFSYTTLQGKTGTLSAHKGKVILVHFWATWCPPCLVEFPQIIDLSEKLKDDVTVLAVSSDNDNDAINRFIKKMRRSLPPNVIIITDPHKDITQGMFQTIRLPETYIIAPDLTIHEKVIGAREDWIAPNRLKILKKLRVSSQ